MRGSHFLSFLFAILSPVSAALATPPAWRVGISVADWVVTDTSGVFLGPRGARIAARSLAVNPGPINVSARLADSTLRSARVTYSARLRGEGVRMVFLTLQAVDAH